MHANAVAVVGRTEYADSGNAGGVAIHAIVAETTRNAHHGVADAGAVDADAGAGGGVDAAGGITYNTQFI